MSLVLAFFSGVILTASLISLGAWLYFVSEKTAKTPYPSTAPPKPYTVIDRSDKAVAAMERRKREGVSAPTTGTTVYETSASE